MQFNRRNFDRPLPRNNGIARRFVVALVLFSSAITTVITAVELYLDYRTDIRGIDERIESIRAVDLHTLTESVWVADRSQVQSHLDGLLHLGDIEYLAIDVDGQTQWLAGARKSLRHIERSFTLIRTYRGRGVNIGELHVVASVDGVLGRLWSRFAVILVSNGVKTILVVVFALIVLQAMVERHLEHLSAHLQHVRTNLADMGELRLRRAKTGRWRPDALDNVSHAVNAMQQDIQASHAEINALNQSLDERVRQRTAELAAANAELETFTYAASHELRAPLRGIDSYSQILLDDHAAALGPEGLSHLHRMRRAIHRMSQLIDDLLKLSRVWRTTLIRTDIDLSAMASEIAEDLQRQAPGRPAEWRIQDGIRVVADGGLIRLVLENLLGNAFKYTRDAALTRIELGAARIDNGVEFCVRDNGAGFDMTSADKLFQPFQRLHGQEEFEGTGVGLATVWRIVQRHGGRVRASSEPRKGATFYVFLPEGVVSRCL
jgi:signal transduction histidine kinase